MDTDTPLAASRPVALTRRRMTFKRWRAELGDAVPLEMVPAMARLSTAKSLDLIKRGLLKVHRFKGVDGRVYRYVRVADIEALRRGGPTKKITWEGMVRAFRAIASQA